MIDDLKERLDRIETKVDGLVKEVAEMRGERAADLRHASWRHSIIAAVVAAVTGAATAKMVK